MAGDVDDSAGEVSVQGPGKDQAQFALVLVFHPDEIRMLTRTVRADLFAAIRRPVNTAPVVDQTRRGTPCPMEGDRLEVLFELGGEGGDLVAEFIQQGEPGIVGTPGGESGRVVGVGGGDHEIAGRHV